MNQPFPMIASLIARIYLGSYRVFRLFQAGSQAVFEGFWLGLLPDPVIDAISQLSYKQGTEYTNARHLDSGLQFWEEIAVRQYFPSQGRVLVASAGGGREMVALTRAGYSTDGFECCKPMVAEGNRALAARGMDCRIQWAPPSRVPELSGIYDAAIIGWNGYTYISPPERRVAFLKSLVPHLRSGAPVLVSGAFRASGRGLAAWTPRIANTVRALTFRAPVFTPGAGFPGRPKHRFTREQLDTELKAAGFSPTGHWKWGDYGAAVCLKGPLSSPGEALHASDQTEKTTLAGAEPR